MITRTAGVVAVTLLLGCSFTRTTTSTGRTQSCMPDRIGPVVDTVGVAGAALIDLGATRCSGDSCAGAFVPFAAATILAATFLVSAIYGYAKNPCPDETELAANEQAQARAELLMRTAVAAARDGDCTTVITLESQVRDVDPEFLDTVFVHDDAIARCERQRELQQRERELQQRGPCLQLRHDAFERANKMSDPHERAKLLKTMPECSEPPTPSTP